MLIDHDKIHIMPLVMGPLFDRETRPGLVYSASESLSIQYDTDPDAIAPLLPPCYQPGPSPVVSIGCMDAHGVGFMAGNGYRFVSVAVAARFDGEQDHVSGGYVVVMFEDETTPIITGREHLGIPKIYADISPHRILEDGRLRCELSLWGHLLLGVELEPLKLQNRLIYGMAAKKASEAPALGYKYIASLDGPPDAEYPTIMWSEAKIDQLWLGSAGRVYFGNPGREDIGYYAPVVDALKTLPVRKVLQTTHVRGSMTLRYDRCRRLR